MIRKLLRLLGLWEGERWEESRGTNLSEYLYGGPYNKTTFSLLQKQIQRNSIVVFEIKCSMQG